MTLRALWIYQAERFPLAKTAPILAVFSAASIAVSAELAERPLPGFGAFLSGFIVAFLIFFQMRACDEWKDLDDDRRYRPTRPIPRGLVSLELILTLGGLSMPLAALAIWLWHPPVLWLLALVWLWLAVMTVEFGVPKWLKARPVLYLVSHMAIMPLIDLLLTGIEWVPGGAIGQGLWLFPLVVACQWLRAGDRAQTLGAGKRDQRCRYLFRHLGPKARRHDLGGDGCHLVPPIGRCRGGDGRGLVHPRTWRHRSGDLPDKRDELCWLSVGQGRKTHGYRGRPVGFRVLCHRRVHADHCESRLMEMLVSQNAATDPQAVGGKAAALSQLAGLGFNPPPFFVIRAEAFASHAPPKGLSDRIAALGEGPFAVRSSARAEDGIEHSHAGQFETVLNVAANDVWATAKKVFDSGFSETVETYRAVKSGGDAEGPAVIVQMMINAYSAGVAFSADPVTGKRDRVVISAIEGLGERLVSGEEDGEDWVVTDTAQGPETPSVLTKHDALAIADLARRAEGAFGRPQDIEWAMDDTSLHILQSRPITTALLPAPQPDNTLTIFDNSNIVESYPGLVSPLTYSFATHVYARVYRAFVALLGVSDATIVQNAAVFDNMLGRVDGRVYYNLVNWYRALALLPGFALNRAYMETMMGVDTPMPAEVTDAIGPAKPSRIGRLAEYLRLARAGLGLIWQAIRLPRTRKGFYDRLNAALESKLDIENSGPTALAAEYRQLESSLLDQWDAPLVNDFLCMIAFGASRNLMEKWLGQDGLLFHNDVMIGQGDIVSAEPARRIAALGAAVRDAGLALDIENKGASALDQHPDIMADFRAYLDKFGDRCTEELKLESIPLSEDPTPLLAAVMASARRGGHSNHSEARTDWSVLAPLNPIKRRFAKWLIRWTKARVRDRENLRFERTRIFGHARRVFLALGREFAARDILDAPRDIFFLTTDEALGAVEGFGLSPDLKSLVALRKAEDESARSRPDPPERIEIRGPAIAPVWAETTAIENTTLVQSGTGCSAGIVTAKARVIRDPRTEVLEPGDILIARHTDPGWIAVFSNAAAIVVERGSLLSHSAIVARELGIPCVVGLKGATSWIRDGETLTVDGATGRVERHDGDL